MTSNQIEFAKHLETQRNNIVVLAETNRSNLAREAETHRANTAAEGLTVASNAEQKRANKAREKENVRTNKANEQIKRQANAEIKRNHLETEAIEWAKLKESQRHAIQTEITEQGKLSETTRHNLIMEGLTEKQIDNAVSIAKINAKAHTDAANIAASASRYNTDAQKVITQWKEAAANWRTKDTNATNTQIQEANRLSNEGIKFAERYAQAVQNQSENDIKREQLKLERWKAKVQKAYQDKRITLDTLNSLTNFVNNLGSSVGRGLRGGRR